jgi:hypothetical protein
MLIFWPPLSAKRMHETSYEKLNPATLRAKTGH